MCHAGKRGLLIQTHEGLDLGRTVINPRVGGDHGYPGGVGLQHFGDQCGTVHRDQNDRVVTLNDFGFDHRDLALDVAVEFGRDIGQFDAKLRSCALGPVAHAPVVRIVHVLDDEGHADVLGKSRRGHGPGHGHGTDRQTQF